MSMVLHLIGKSHRLIVEFIYISQISHYPYNKDKIKEEYCDEFENLILSIKLIISEYFRFTDFLNKKKKFYGKKANIYTHKVPH